MSAHLSDAAVAAILAYLRDEIGFASFARDLSTHIDHLAAENARLREALTPLAGIPLEEFGWEQHRPDKPIAGWNKHTLYVRDVLAARAALSPAPAKKENERG